MSPRPPFSSSPKYNGSRILAGHQVRTGMRFAHGNISGFRSICEVTASRAVPKLTGPKRRTICIYFGGIGRRSQEQRSHGRRLAMASSRFRRLSLSFSLFSFVPGTAAIAHIISGEKQRKQCRDSVTLVGYPKTPVFDRHLWCTLTFTLLCQCSRSSK